MKIDNNIFQSYLTCRFKAHLILSGKIAERHPYDLMLLDRKKRFRKAATELLARSASLRGVLNAEQFVSSDIAAGLPLLLDATADTESVQFHFDALLLTDKPPASGPPKYSPVLFHPVDTVREQHKLLLAFGGTVLGDVQGHLPSVGKIVFGGPCKITTVRLGPYYDRLREIVSDLRAMAEGTSTPAFALNDHCQSCEFRQYCEAKAKAEDHLSLLGRMTTKDMQHYAAKGIFTVAQLSYTFRPRRRSKRLRDRPIPHSLALQALAIRENKTHVIGVPQLPNSPVHVYLDTEGDSTGKRVYLIGAIVVGPNGETSHSFWADDCEQQCVLFQQLLDVLEPYDDFRVFHYGSYDAQYLKRMRALTKNKKAADKVIESATNVLSLVHSRIYFPTRTNSLKEIGRVLGSSWTEPDSSGLQTLVWRYRWEETRGGQWKQKLVQYNYEDCLALKRLTEVIYDIAQRADSRNAEGREMPGIAWVKDADPFPQGREWQTVKFQVTDFDYINKCAYFDYQRERIYLRSSEAIRQAQRRTRRRKQRRLRATKQLSVTGRTCPNCKRKGLPEIGQKVFVKQAFDLRITPAGIRRSVTEYQTKRLWCSDCRRAFLPHGFRRMDPFRHSLKSWVMYLHIAHQVSLPKLQHLLGELFEIEITINYVHMMKAMMARHYRQAYNSLLKTLLSGNLIHVDETEIKLKNTKGYVWVLTNLEEVVFFYRPTREGACIKEILAGFQGVLVSDFYSAYDSLDCRQQKCLIHLIRDFNGDVLSNPFNDELKNIAIAFGRLLRPIIETIDRRGLKKQWLGRHRHDVDRFFDTVCATEYTSEVAKAYRQRLLKHRGKLFTFLEEDGVPWNNNNAEHAIKEFAHYRENMDGMMCKEGLEDYLVLLSICVTCKYKGIDFLQFLLSRRSEIDGFARHGRRKNCDGKIELYPKGFPNRYRGTPRTTNRSLLAVAESRGVGKLYESVMLAVRPFFHTMQHTVNGVTFLAAMGKKGSRNRVFFVVPKDSSAEDGLRFEVYVDRLTEVFGMIKQAALKVLPKYTKMDRRDQAGEFGGGFFSDASQVEAFVSELAKGGPPRKRWQRSR